MNKRVKKEIRDWGIFIGAFLLLYAFGLHTEVIGKVQQLFLYTGLISPDAMIASDQRQPLDSDMLLINLDGQQVKLSELKGQPVFINFWASWCPPCVAEMPNIHNLYETHGRKVHFVMLSLDENRDKAVEFMSDKEFEFPLYFPASNIPGKLQSSSIPTTFVLDNNQRIALKVTGFADYDTQSFRAAMDHLAEENK
jgi:thiol-disulfide isomerase/thioredoxin